MSIPIWWQDAVAYQIYPRSFADSNGDGIGDLQGVINKLDYLQDLGIGAIWFSPFFPSPQVDHGYDVSDYEDVAPEYGTLADFDTLLEEAHRRGIRIILDLVLNHTSDQHRWFKQSRSSRDNLYRDWYIWRDGVDGNPPNDWESTFGGSAWEYDETTGQYYYHFFYKEQPDLNWRNPKVQRAMESMVRFWLERGVDGFRLDAIGALFEREDLPNADVDKSIVEIWHERLLTGEAWSNYIDRKLRHQHDLEEVHYAMQDLRRVVDQYDDRIILGESSKVSFYGNGSNEFHSLFNFEWTNIGAPDPAAIRAMLQERLPSIPRGVWECNPIGNHDRPRAASVWGDAYRIGLALNMFLRGTPMFYNGEEIGMTDYFLTSVDDFQDGIGVWAYHGLLQMGFPPEDAVQRAQEMVARDKCRTPMQWSDAPNGGFSPEDVSPWLCVNPNYDDGINVEDERKDPKSTLNYFRALSELRRTYIALRRGDFELAQNNKYVLGFWRRYKTEACFVAVNCTTEPQTVSLGMSRLYEVYSSTHNRVIHPAEVRRLSAWVDLANLHLKPYEVWVGIV